MKMFGMPSNSHLHCDNSGHARAGVVDAYDIQDPYSLVPELPALEHEPSNSSLSQIFIRSCNGISLLNMDLRGATVETLKLVVEEREGTPVDEQYLILDGHKPLRDGTLLTDYDALLLGGQATVEVFLRIRGGKPLVELLPVFAACHVEELRRDFVLSKDFKSWDGRNKQLVLTTLGVRILRGIMSCVLAAHQAGLAYNGSLQIGHLVVSGFSRGKVIVPETVAVRINDQTTAAEISTAPLTPEGQKKDYASLAAILGRVFRNKFPLHVDTIHAMLGNLAAAGGLDLPPATTQLLQAFVAMADPLVMATMWWNLMRFANSLGPPAWQWNDGVKNWVRQPTTIERLVFEHAVDQVRLLNGSWNHTVSNPQFSNINISRGNYRFCSPTDLLRFARNWFTHAPEAQGKDALKVEQRVAQSSSAVELPDLDYYFSCGFDKFMAQVLEHLYIREYSLGVRCDDLTRVLVPPS